MERLLGYWLMAALTFGGYAAQVTGNAKAAELLEQTRAALGGEAAMDKVHGLSATGSVTRAAGNMQLAGDITLQFQLPDRMLRTDRDRCRNKNSRQGYRPPGGRRWRASRR